MDGDITLAALDRLQVTDAVTALEWSTTGLAIGCGDGSLWRWRALETERIESGHRSGITAVRCAADGTLFSLDHAGRLARHGRVDPHPRLSGIEHIASLGLIGVADGTIEIGLHTSQPSAMTSGMTTPTAFVALGGGTVALGSFDQLAWFDLRVASVEGRIDVGPIDGLAADPTGRVVACGDTTGSLHVIDLATGDGVELDGYAGRVALVAIDSDGGSVAAVADDELTLWRLDRGAVIDDAPLCIHAHDEQILVLAASPSRRAYASGDLDGRVAVVRADGTTAMQLEVASPVTALAWEPGGTALAVGTIDGRVHLVIT
jgi:WD40 repeat protein